MKAMQTELPEVLLLEPRVIADFRGDFHESWNEAVFRAATGLDVTFVQDNQSHSHRQVLRGIHYQLGRPQGKLVRVAHGTIRDVVIDLRRSSPRFGRWAAFELSAENHRQVWIPPCFGHGYAVLSASATCLYKTTEYWSAEGDRAIRWNDPQLAIDWRVDWLPILAARDAEAPFLAQAEVYE